MISGFHDTDTTRDGIDYHRKSTSIYVYLRKHSEFIDFVVLQQVFYDDIEGEEDWVVSGYKYTIYTKTISLTDFNIFDMRENIKLSTMKSIAEIEGGNNFDDDRRDIPDPSPNERQRFIDTLITIVGPNTVDKTILYWIRKT